VKIGTSAENDPEQAHDPARQLDADVAVGRRRLLRGGLSAAPVIMTLASGPVSAGLCQTASAFGSLHPSGTKTSLSCGGLSPSTWAMTDYRYWPLDANSLFSTHFAPPLGDTNAKLKQVIDPSKGYDAVARNCVAALLNASGAQPRTPPSILSATKAKEIWSTYKGKGFEPTAGIQWTSAQIVTWITTTYS
jgi:hypothetical protein